jgi:hypothetical protein
MDRYHKSTLGTREFKLIMMELVALAVHEVAVRLFTLQPKCHSAEMIERVTMFRHQGDWMQWGRKMIRDPTYDFYYARYPQPHTLFSISHYYETDQYPNGWADAAGFWAEDQIFGGVVLFDRGESGVEVCNPRVNIRPRNVILTLFQNKDIYFHSGRKDSTWRIWRLLEKQLDSMVEYMLTADDVAKGESPFPTLDTRQNLHRHDPWDAMALHHVYRQRWERKIGDTKDENEGSSTRSVNDYPELENSLFQKIEEAIVDDGVSVPPLLEAPVRAEIESLSKELAPEGLAHDVAAKAIELAKVYQQSLRPARLLVEQAICVVTCPDVPHSCAYYTQQRPYFDKYLI